MLQGRRFFSCSKFNVNVELYFLFLIYQLNVVIVDSFFLIYQLNVLILVVLIKEGMSEFFLIYQLNIMIFDMCFFFLLIHQLNVLILVVLLIGKGMLTFLRVDPELSERAKVVINCLKKENM